MYVMFKNSKKIENLWYVVDLIAVDMHSERE